MSGRSTAIARARVLRGALLDAGVPEVSIEVVDGRPASGDSWNACKPIGLLSHHIASYPTPARPTPGLALVKAGRPDLDGPLCNGTAGVDLVYRIICMGLANHPGTGGPWTIRGPMGSFTVPKDSARAYVWGTEYEGGFDDATWNRVYTNRRTGISMDFHEYMARANVGLSRGIWLINGLGRTPKPGDDLSGYHGEHFTWAGPRKSDRRGYTTDSGRAAMRAFDAPPKRQEEDEMTPKDVWDYAIKPMVKGAKAIPARTMLSQAHLRSLRANENAWAASQNAARAVSLGKSNAAAIRALSASVEPTVRKAVEDALGDDANMRTVTAADAPAEPDDTPEDV